MTRETTTGMRRTSQTFETALDKAHAEESKLNEKTPPWDRALRLPPMSDDLRGATSRVLLPLMLRRALDSLGKRPLLSLNHRGYLSGDGAASFNSLEEQLSSLGLYQIHRQVVAQPLPDSAQSLAAANGTVIEHYVDDDPDDEADRVVYVGSDPLCAVDVVRKDHTVGVFVYCEDRVLLDRIGAVARAVAPKLPDDAGGVYLLVTSSEGISFRRSKAMGVPLERGNYGPDVLASYDRAVTEISSDRPSGRLLLLDGPPGTGKTYLVRGLIYETRERCAFVVVPAGTVSKMVGPDLLSSLMEAADDQWPSRHTVLLIEDADGALLPRGGDNEDSISTLLNLGDGIVGDAVDVRIVATTNAKRVEVDEALLREGRLLEHVHVPRLDAATAERVFERLCAKNAKNGTASGWSPTQAKTLAEVYAASRTKRAK